MERGSARLGTRLRTGRVHGVVPAGNSVEPSTRWAVDPSGVEGEVGVLPFLDEGVTPVAAAHRERPYFEVSWCGWELRPGAVEVAPLLDKNRMCSARARRGRGCPVRIAISIQTLYSSGQRSMASESLAPRSRGDLIGSQSAILACCRLMRGGDGMLMRVQVRRGARKKNLQES